MLAELGVTEDDGSLMAVEEGRVAAGWSISHIGIKQQSKTGGWYSCWVDEHVKAVTEDRA